MSKFQLGVPTCQKACQFFKHSSYEMLKELSILYYYIKSYTYMICIVHKSCAILYFYTSCHIKKSVRNLCFLKVFYSLVKKAKTWFLYVTSNKGFSWILHSYKTWLKQLNKVKNTSEYCDLLELWSAFVRDPK